MQNNPTQRLKEFAQQLLVYEAGNSAGLAGSAAFRVCEKLRQPLTKVMGAGGFHALFSRALTLAGAKFSWLKALKIRADGSLEGLGELETKLSREEIILGEVALVAQLLELLTTFIGPALTLGLVQEVWPDAAFNKKLEN